MDGRFQFGIRNGLISVAWVATWFGAWGFERWIEEATPPPHLWLSIVATFLLIALPAVAIGALAGRHLLGWACGTASAVGYIFYVMNLP
jgi:hypothetical protein